MKSKQLIFLILEGVLVLAAVGVVYFLGFMQVVPTTVYRFTKSLPANTIITEKDIEAFEVPYSAVTPDFVVKVDDLLGHATKSEVYPGQYVFNAQLKEASELTAFDRLDLSDKVKVAIPIEELSQALGGLLNSGDVVDLYYTGKYEELGDASTEGAYYTTRFMEDVVIYKVLSETANEVNNSIETGIPNIDKETKAEIPNAGDVAHIIVAVTAEQALEIQTRLQTGTISLVGRFKETVNTDIRDFLLSPGDGVSSGFGSVEKEK